MTVLKEALQRAGAGTPAEARLRRELALYLNQGGTIERLQAIVDDVRSRLSAGGHCESGHRSMDAAGGQPYRGPEKGQISGAHQSSFALPVREPSAADKRAMRTVEKFVAVTIFETYRVRDGRKIGDVQYGELGRLRTANAREAALMLLIQQHGVASPETRIRDFIKAHELQRLVQKAAEVADVS